MHLEIDVSGADIFTESYFICLSAGNGRIKGFKVNQELINQINEGWAQGKYTKYPYQPNNQGTFKARIYNAITKLLLNEIFKGFEDELIGVLFCRDFPGHEGSIKASLNHCITYIHNKKVSKITCDRLPKNSDAHRYAKMMHGDIYNYLEIYVPITLEQIEQFLIWKDKK